MAPEPPSWLELVRHGGLLCWSGTGASDVPVLALLRGECRARGRAHVSSRLRCRQTFRSVCSRPPCDTFLAPGAPMTTTVPGQPPPTWKDRLRSFVSHLYHGWFVVLGSGGLLAYLLDERFKARIDSVVFAASPRWVAFALGALGVLVGGMSALWYERGKLSFFKGSVIAILVFAVFSTIAALARPPEPALLQVGTFPPAHKAQVDGKDFGPLPFPKLCLQAGAHAVVLEHSSYQPQECRVRLCSGAVTELYWDWKGSRLCEVKECQPYTRPEP